MTQPEPRDLFTGLKESYRHSYYNVTNLTYKKSIWTALATVKPRKPDLWNISDEGKVEDTIIWNGKDFAEFIVPGIFDVDNISLRARAHTGDNLSFNPKNALRNASDYGKTQEYTEAMNLMALYLYEVTGEMTIVPMKDEDKGIRTDINVGVIRNGISFCADADKLHMIEKYPIKTIGGVKEHGFTEVFHLPMSGSVFRNTLFRKYVHLLYRNSGYDGVWEFFYND